MKKNSSRMYYSGMFTIPITFKVEVCEVDLMIDKARDVLREKAVKQFDEKYGNVFVADYKEAVIDPFSIRGLAIDFLSNDEIKHWDRILLSGRQKKSSQN